MKIKLLDKRNLQPMPKIRVDGYYYVLFGKRWQIALYEEGDWYLPGMAGEIEENIFDEVSERCIATLTSLKVVSEESFLNHPSVKRYNNPRKK